MKFISDLTESNKANNDGADDMRMRALSWDVLEVNRYLVDGINGSGLDKFFDREGKGQIPTVTPYDVRAPAVPATLEDAIKAARQVLDKPPHRPWDEVSVVIFLQQPQLMGSIASNVFKFGH